MTASKNLKSLRMNPAFAALLFLVIPQFILLGTRSLPDLTAIKLLWIVFNIGSVILLFQFATEREKNILINGIVFSVVLNSTILIIDWMGIAFSVGAEPLIGFAQLGNDWSRPHAFYYEPSYVSSSLALALPFLLMRRNSWLAMGFLLFIIFLIGARTGLLFFLVYCSIIWVFEKEYLFVNLKAISICTIMLLIISFSPKSLNYFTYVFRDLGPWAVVERVGQKSSSEGGRIQQVLEELTVWRQNPLFGAGITHRGGERHGLDPLAVNCWAEILSEWGLQGLVSVLWLFMILFRTAKLLESKIAVFAHCVVNLNFTQTLPRLDFWILLLALVYLRQGRIGMREK